MSSLVRYRLKRLFHFFRTGLLEGWLSELRYNFPARKVTILCVTGTDGKTTTSTLLYQLLTAAGCKTGLISTVGAYIGDEVVDTGFHVTSPSPRQVHRILRTMVNQGVTHVVLETTSHGIYQYRTWGIKAAISGLTNITHEHLDYHVTWHEYAKAKRHLLVNSQQVFINAEDKSLNFLNKLGWPRSVTVHQYAALEDLPKTITAAIQVRFPESYNQANATLAFLMAKAAVVTPNKPLEEAILKFPGVPGRMETVTTKPCTVIVDFAHTPNALERAIKAARQKVGEGGRVITVFGCAGERDWRKRPLMGKISAQEADFSIFTAEDPRHENVWSIIQQMKDGIELGRSNVLSIADRREAIAFAIHHLAKTKDIVLITGKGHEQSMAYGEIEYPWNDIAVVKELT